MNEESWNSENIPPVVQTALIFAARYTHHRNTGGTLAVTNALKLCWGGLSENVRNQIIEECFEATCNTDDWDRLVVFHNNQK